MTINPGLNFNSISPSIPEINALDRQTDRETDRWTTKWSYKGSFLLNRYATIKRIKTINIRLNVRNISYLVAELYVVAYLSWKINIVWTSNLQLWHLQSDAVSLRRFGLAIINLFLILYIKLRIPCFTLFWNVFFIII